MALADAGAFEHAGEIFEVLKAVRKQAARRLGGIGLKDDVVGCGDGEA